MEIFSSRLKWSRINQGFTQGEVAESIGMSQPGYGKLENGQREPNLETLAKISHFINERSDFLIGLTDFSNKVSRTYERFQDHYKNYLEYQDQLTKEMGILDIDRSVSELRITYLRERISRFNHEMMRRHGQTLELLDNIPFVKEETIESVKRYEYIRK
jgi:transcriptional regulator with XRE-family HTH domain